MSVLSQILSIRHTSDFAKKRAANKIRKEEKERHFCKETVLKLDFLFFLFPGWSWGLVNTRRTSNTVKTARSFHYKLRGDRITEHKHQVGKIIGLQISCGLQTAWICLILLPSFFGLNRHSCLIPGCGFVVTWSDFEVLWWETFFRPKIYLYAASGSWLNTRILFSLFADVWFSACHFQV